MPQRQSCYDIYIFILTFILPNSTLMTDDKKCIKYVGCPASLRKLDDPPGRMARCKILSIDLEVYSSRGDKVFPKATVAGDEIFMASAVFQVSGEPSSRKKILFTLFDVSEGLDDDEDELGYELRVFPDELSLVRGFASPKRTRTF